MVPLVPHGVGKSRTAEAWMETQCWVIGFTPWAQVGSPWRQDSEVLREALDEQHT